jgi:radical SAM protein with 4Fe4S-binding SPASM domain
MTLKRVWNYFLLKSSFSVSNLIKKPVHWGKPMAVSIEPTTTCNLKCPQCPSGLRNFTRPTGSISLEENRLILNQLGTQLGYVNYYFQGEPFIHPDFLSLVKEARKRNIYVVTSTNAHFISPEKATEIVASGLNELIISIDGLDQKAYETYRVNGKLDKVIAGTKNIIAAKKQVAKSQLWVVFQFLVTSANEHQIEALYELANNLGVDEVRLKTIQIYDVENENDLLPINPQYSRYRKNKNGVFELKNKFKNKCWRMWSSAVFTWDGKVVPCCFDKDAEFQMGSLNEIDFDTIWKSAIYKDFRRKLQEHRQGISICTNCSEGSKVWV